VGLSLGESRSEGVGEEEMTEKKLFKIGDTVFQSEYSRQEKFVTCPDCLGTKRIKVVLGDGTEISIECVGCNPGGYNPPMGLIRQYEYGVEVKKRQVTGVKETLTEIEYELDKFNSCYRRGTNNDTFATEEEAIAHGESEKKIHEDKENKRMMAKTKDARSWAWNATYHRNQIRHLEKELEYQRAKAVICKAHVRESK
jgi:hypothetical protein